MKLYRLTTFIFLVFSVINLGLMVPGGVVETRDFSSYSSLILAAFNIFLTCLGLGSLLLAYAVIRFSKGYLVSFIAGILYVLVYLSDIFKIFPVSTAPMPELLLFLECLGIVLGTALCVSTFISARTSTDNEVKKAGIKIPAPIIITLLLLGIAITIFATISAKG